MFARPVKHIAATGTSEPHRLEGSRMPWIPAGSPVTRFPGKVKARIMGIVVCMPK